MKLTHSTRVSGAVWFKHKYLTNPAVTSDDWIVAVIGGLAKTLTTKIPPQLRDKPVDKHGPLQDILQPKPDNIVKTVPEQAPVRAPRVRTPYVYTPNLTPEENEATTPRVLKN